MFAAKFSRYPRLSEDEFQVSRISAYFDSVLLFFELTSSPNVVIVDIPSPISCSHESLDVASHCSFGAGKGRVQGCSVVAQSVRVMMTIVREMRNQILDVLLSR